MEYNNIHKGIFVSRPNRFIAMVEINGVLERCHVKNTGRCRELLIPGAFVYLERSSRSGRKTLYDLIGVEKGSNYINMDSQAPNKVVAEWLKEQNWESLRGEYTYGASRLDFYMEQEGRRRLLEVKGVTLEEQGIAKFPDAPTLRGVKHLEELIRARSEGYEAAVLFVIQMKGVWCFQPNDVTHPAFGETLRRASRAGVEILAYDCEARPQSLRIDEPVPVYL